MKNLQGYSRALAKRILDAVGEYDSCDAEAKRLRNRKAQFDEQAQGIKAGSRAVREAEDLANRIKDIETRIDDLRDRRDRCAEEDSACREELRGEISTLNAQKTQLATDLRDKQRKASQDMRDHERLKGQAESVQAQIDDNSTMLLQKLSFIAKGKQLIFDLFANLAKLEGGSASVDIAPPPATGATVLADGVNATCGWLSFGCTGVSWVLRGLGAIFGSSKIEANFEQHNNHWANRSYERDAVSMRPGLVVFKR